VYLHNWASIHHIPFRDNQELINNQQVSARFQKEVKDLNLNLGDHEKIKRFRIVTDEWTLPSGELSPTLKLKRNVLYEKYADVIKEIFSVDRTDGIR
jgi:long-chain acyl-CoA synthetase